jgi:sugar transferase EpsL
MSVHATAKRSLDVLFSAIALIGLAPTLALLALVVWLTMGRPVLFRQQRLGLHGRPFTVLKFRTMRNDRDADGHLLPDAERTTRIGGLLRATSLDELPQLWNVLKGEMSLVGTRPHPLKYLDRYSPEQRRRLDVKPGLTTLSAVNGRNAQSWSDKLAWDIAYVERQSLWLDLSILGRTVLTVISRRGASDVAPMPEFLGTEKEADG